MDPFSEETHPIIQLIINNDRDKLKTLVKVEDINKLYPCKERECYISPLSAAVLYHRMDICDFLLTEGEADPDWGDDGPLPLHYACGSAPVEYMRRLIKAGAGINVCVPRTELTPLHIAALHDKPDVMTLLIDAGSLTYLLPPTHPQHHINDKISKLVDKLASSDDEKYSKIKRFHDVMMAIQQKSPGEVFEEFGSHMLEENPLNHLTPIDILFNVVGEKNEEYQQKCIKWLKDNNKLNFYIENVAKPFPDMIYYFPNTIDSVLQAIFNTMEEIPSEASLALIPQLLKLLSTRKESTEMLEEVLSTLYVITQKTKVNDDWNQDFINSICTAIVPYVGTKHTSDVRMYTYGTLANLLANLPSFIHTLTSKGIDCVPEVVFMSADTARALELKKRLIQLHTHLSKTEPSKQQRVWNRISERWSLQLEKLANTHEDDKVVKVENVVMGKGGEFRIAKGSDGTQVFLGLRDDGTEVAVKRMTKSNYEVLKNKEGFLRLPELDDPYVDIVRYVDFVQDENFGYLVLQLCEYTLEEYIKLGIEFPGGRLCEKTIAQQVLTSLKILHQQHPSILHRDIKPQNVLIDVSRKARFADFGFCRSRRRGQTTYSTRSLGTKCWKAKETNNEDDGDGPADIQVAGMLLYYIMSGGHHPFGKGPRCEVNILDGKYNLDHVQDVVAKDLIERMINEDPKKRPTVEECLAHPYFWTNQMRINFLLKVANENEIDKHYENPDHQNLMEVWNQCAEEGLFSTWKDSMKDKLPQEVFEKMEKMEKFPYHDDGFGLLRFIRDLHQRHAEAAADIDLMEMFPGLFDCVYLFAHHQGWNERVTLKKMFGPTSTHLKDSGASSSDGAQGESPCQPPAPKTPKTQGFGTFMATNIITLKEPLHTQREWNRISKRWSQQLEKLANTEIDKVVKVGSVVMGKGDEFLIAEGSDGTEVFLGLRDDGTEVAVKRMTKSNYEVLKNEPGFLRLPELEHPSIVKYVDFVEDENFGYLALQLCEYTLEEYIKLGSEFPGGSLSERELAEQFLTGLKMLHHHNPPILHRDIKPQNVLIDVTRKARLADFGISRRLTSGQTTHLTSSAGTKCWKARETINEDGGDEQVRYKRSADIQVAGMLLYYILSGGHHPFGKGTWCEVNILKAEYNLDQVQDVVAKDLIERMINKEPKNRPTVEECLDHPYFWGNEKRVEFLKLIGNEEEVEKYYKTPDHQNLMAGLLQRARKGLFDGWKGKMREKLPKVFQEMEKRRPYSENEPFGLLRFIRNLHQHHAEAAAGIDLMEMFPGLFDCVYLFAQDQKWNKRITLKNMFMATNKPLHTQREWNRVSKRWSKQLEKLANTHKDDKVVKVGNGVMGKSGEFRITNESDGTEVFLGLRDDGTEVAVKRMTTLNYEVLKNEQGFSRLPELDDPSIVRYVDLVEDENFGYLALQLCDYTLEEYIKLGSDFPGGSLSERELAEQVLTSLKILHHQNPPILHRDIKPQNVFIDVTRKARLANFGIRSAGVRHASYTRSADIQVAGMLLYYILSGGDHPFGTEDWGRSAIPSGHYDMDDVHDFVAIDLIEWMINEDPEKRPTVEECLAHPYFWGNEKKVEFLKLFGNEEEVKNCSHPDHQELRKDLDRRGPLMMNDDDDYVWTDTIKAKLPEVFQEMEKRRGKTGYSEDGFELLRFIRNLHEDHAEAAADIDLMEMFPDLFECVYLFVQERGWNTRVTLEKMLRSTSTHLSDSGASGSDGALMGPPAHKRPRASSSDGASSSFEPAPKTPKKSA